MLHLTCIGELLIDFFSNSPNLVQATEFTKKAGGAPANVAAGVAKLGGEAAFVGKVGADPFGDFLRNKLQQYGVATEGLLQDASASTTLAFVSVGDDGERDFVFNRGADELLQPHEVPQQLFTTNGIWHFGAATALLGGPLYKTYHHCLQQAQVQQQFIAFDPNFRTDLWRGREQEFIDRASKCLPFAHFTKVSENELELLSGNSDTEKALPQLQQQTAGAVAVTLGGEGTLLALPHTSQLLHVPAEKVKIVDTTGAGDSFVAGVLYQLAKLEVQPQQQLEVDQWRQMITFANKVAADTCTRVGAW